LSTVKKKQIKHHNMKTGTVGRPYKPDSDKGTVRVELRLTPKQAERLTSKVEQSNLTTSAFIRQKIGIR
jgi:hypothetical protein